MADGESHFWTLSRSRNKQNHQAATGSGGHDNLGMVATASHTMSHHQMKKNLMPMGLSGHVQHPAFNIAVVGLSGTERERGALGIGKSCLCNRFIRPRADDFNPEHIAVLSQTDFGGRVVNNDHWLYWGEVTKVTEEGHELTFSLVEQTEFVDDATHHPFHASGSKTEPYYKRCAVTKLTSPEKLMYICKNQLGIEKEYEQRFLGEGGRFAVDGFVVVFDVSLVEGRDLGHALETTALIINNLVRTKKPIVVAATKQDEMDEYWSRELQLLVCRKEYKGNIPLVETSAFEGVNVDTPFIICAQLADRSRGKVRVIPYGDAYRARHDLLEVISHNFYTLLATEVSDYRTLWSGAKRRLAQSTLFLDYCDHFGIAQAERTFKRHIRQLKDEFKSRKMRIYLDLLPDILNEILPDMDTLNSQAEATSASGTVGSSTGNNMHPDSSNTEWSAIKNSLRNHPDFDNFFLYLPEQVWHEVELLERENDNRIPFDLLDTPEAESVFLAHRHALETSERRRDLRVQFKQLLQESGYVVPGVSFSEAIRLLSASSPSNREWINKIPHGEMVEIYEQHQREITDIAKQNFQELLLEHSDLFYDIAAMGPGAVITQTDIVSISEVIGSDSRYKALDGMESDRKLILLRHIGFLHDPVTDHCPSQPYCMESLIEKVISLKARRPSFWMHHTRYSLNENGENENLQLLVLGLGEVASQLGHTIDEGYSSFEYEGLDYSVDTHVVDSSQDLDQLPMSIDLAGVFCVYSNHMTLEFVRDCLEKQLLARLAVQNQKNNPSSSMIADRLPFTGRPVIILFTADPDLEEHDMDYLRQEGLTCAQNLQCHFIDVTSLVAAGSLPPSRINAHHHPQTLIPHPNERFHPEGMKDVFRSLVDDIQKRADMAQIYNQVALPEAALQPELRLLMCVLCGDSYLLEQVLSPFLSQFNCWVTSVQSFTLEVNLEGENRTSNAFETLLPPESLSKSKVYVEIILTSYHGAQAFRDDLLHGFILVYSARRPASYAVMSAFTGNIPNTPIQIVAVTDSSNALNYYSNIDVSHELITQGNDLATKLSAHFVSSSTAITSKGSAFNNFYLDALDRKPHIEKAFEMEDSDTAYSMDTPPSTILPQNEQQRASRHTPTFSVASHRIKDATQAGLMVGPVPPPVPCRQDSYHLRTSSLDDNAEMSEGIYEPIASHYDMDINQLSGPNRTAPQTQSNNIDDINSANAAVNNAQILGGNENEDRPSSAIYEAIPPDGFRSNEDVAAIVGRGGLSPSPNSESAILNDDYLPPPDPAPEPQDLVSRYQSAIQKYTNNSTQSGNYSFN